ncbi:MAG: hypothetical protein HY537_13420 [Deltaproteobacteria bacterium]|nr:hypothetical protein [Deltaproteobacteria bacterium]
MKNTFLETYRFREVLYNTLLQDLKLKYKRTLLGYFWSLLNPILQLVVLSFVFSHFMRLGVREYALFLFSGLLAWNFFHNTVLACSSSVYRVA